MARTMRMTSHALEGHHAIITGGGRGIGYAIAAVLAAGGARVTIMGRNASRLEVAAEQLSRAGGTEAAAFTCDVSDESSVRAAFEAARERFGVATILVNNAGQADGAPFLDTDRALWDRMIAVNLTGTYLCTQQVLGGMLAAKSGRIINIASTAGLKGYRNITAYCASKHAVVGLTRALAREVARQGVTVNAVCPAYTETDMADNAVATIVRDMGRTEAEAKALLAKGIPLGRLIRPDEVASAVAWLCAPEASGVTGIALPVAGGEV
jgi:NAD(P)-dependent dehydrogenase (short-subunit alcohol dehydrogenase family)